MGREKHAFSPSSKNKFLAAFYKLKLEDVQSLIDKGNLDNDTLLDVHVGDDSFAD